MDRLLNSPVLSLRPLKEGRYDPNRPGENREKRLKSSDIPEMINEFEKRLLTLPFSEEFNEQVLEEFRQEMWIFLLSAIKQNMSISYVRNRMNFNMAEMRAELKVHSFDEAMPETFRLIKESQVQLSRELSERYLDLESLTNKFMPLCEIQANEYLAPRILNLAGTYSNVKEWFESFFPNWKTAERRILSDLVLNKRKIFLIDLYPKLVKVIDNYDVRLNMVGEVHESWVEHLRLLKIIKELPLNTRIRLLCSECAEDTGVDVWRMLKKVDINLYSHTLKEAQSFNEFHDMLVQIINEAEDTNLKQNKVKQRIKLKTSAFKKEYEVWIPDNEFDFVLLGKTLHNCVGSYFDTALAKKTWVIALKKDNFFKYCIEISPKTKTIKQFVSNYNQSAPIELVEEFQEFLTMNLS